LYNRPACLVYPPKISMDIATKYIFCMYFYPLADRGRLGCGWKR
jgi:hypothetical protein